MESAATDQDGRFRLALDAGSYELVASPPQGSGWANSLANSLPVAFNLPDANARETGIRLVLQPPPPVNIEGVVYDPDGAPQPGAGVALFTQELGGPPVSWAVTDQVYGKYQFAGLNPGTYWVQAYPPDSLWNLAESDEMQVQVNAPDELITQNLSLRLPSLIGKVVLGIRLGRPYGQPGAGCPREPAHP